MDFLDIGDKLAAKYVSGTLTPPSGYHAIRNSTARVPNAIPTSPWVNVMLPRGDVTLEPGSLHHEAEYHVWFHYAKQAADLKRDMTAMLAWLGVLLDATYSDMDLSVSQSGVTINKAYVTEYQLAVFTWGGDEYYGWDITVVVDATETKAMAK